MAAEFKIKNGLVVTTGGVNITGISILNNTVVVGGANSADPYILNSIGATKFYVADTVNNYNSTYTFETAGITSKLWNANTEGRITQVISSGSVDVTSYVQDWNAGGNYTYQRITKTKYEIDQKLGNVVIKNIASLPAVPYSFIVVDSSGRLYKGNSALTPTYDNGLYYFSGDNFVGLGGTLIENTTIDMDAHTLILQDGVLQVTSLAGSGTRMVVVDAAGNMSTQAIGSGSSDTNFAISNLTATGNRTHTFAGYSLTINNLLSLSMVNGNFTFDMTNSNIVHTLADATRKILVTSTPNNHVLSFRNQTTGSSVMQEYSFSNTGIRFSNLATGAGTKMVTVNNTGDLGYTDLPLTTTPSLQQVITAGATLTTANVIITDNQNFTIQNTSGDTTFMRMRMRGAAFQSTIDYRTTDINLSSTDYPGLTIESKINVSSANGILIAKVNPSTSKQHQLLVNDARIQLHSDYSLILELDNLPSATTSNVLYYDSSTKRVTYGVAPSGGGGPEADTLASVTGRGATTSTAITITNTVTANALLLTTTPDNTTFKLGTQTPTYYIGQSMAGSDLWKIYGEGATDNGKMVLEVGDDGTEAILMRFKQAGVGTDAVDIEWQKTFVNFSSLSNFDFKFGGTNRFRFATNGDFHASNDITAFSTTWSDMRLKTNIKPLENALEKVKQLTGVSFDWNVNDRGADIGFIAQEVEKIIPEVVKEKQNTFFSDTLMCKNLKTVNYQALVALLAEAIKEQQKQIEELKNRL